MGRTRHLGGGGHGRLDPVDGVIDDQGTFVPGADCLLPKPGRLGPIPGEGGNK